MFLRIIQIIFLIKLCSMNAAISKNESDVITKTFSDTLPQSDHLNKVISWPPS